MLCVYVIGDEIGSLAHDLRKNHLAVSINECHVTQLDNAFTPVRTAMPFTPG
ncbi:MAG TPA: hypothetical protein VK638_25820 [Edaphobacter sp.]|jgi:hypothetical protein|nr:hypothetical protein [Edaphobacter sp.]